MKQSVAPKSTNPLMSAIVKLVLIEMGIHIDWNCIVTITEFHWWIALTQATGFRHFENPLFQVGLICNATTGVIVWRVFGVLVLHRVKPYQGFSSVMHKYQVEPRSRLVWEGKPSRVDTQDWRMQDKSKVHVLGMWGKMKAHVLVRDKSKVLKVELYPRLPSGSGDYVVIVEEVKSTVQARYTMTYIAYEGCLWDTNIWRILIERS